MDKWTASGSKLKKIRVKLQEAQSDDHYRNNSEFWLNCATDNTFLFPLSSDEELQQKHTRLNEAILCYALPLSARLYKVAQSHAAIFTVASTGPIWSLADSSWSHGVNQVLRWQNALGSNKRTERAELN